LGLREQAELMSKAKTAHALKKNLFMFDELMADRQLSGDGSSVPLFIYDTCLLRKILWLQYVE